MVITVFQYLDDDDKTVYESVIIGTDESDCFNELWEVYGVGREQAKVVSCEPVEDPTIRAYWPDVIRAWNEFGY